MRRHLGLITATLFLVASNGTLLAQSGSRGLEGAAGGALGGSDLAGGAVGGTGTSGLPSVGTTNAASTAAEGIARGRAAVIQSVGQGQLHVSEAAVNYQEAYRRWIENRVAIQEAENEILRSKLERVTLENALRDGRASRFRELRDSVRENRPRTSTTRFVAVDGSVEWPRPLESGLFYEHRTRLEMLFAERSMSDDVVRIERELQHEIDAMRSTWKRQIRKVHPSTYLAGKNFIGVLELELSFPPEDPMKNMVMSR